MQNTIKLNARIELLTKKNIRDKLISYFNIQSSKNFSKTFSLPFSLTDLADYLSVDRSAMMRELSHLKEEGFIKKEGNKITLLMS
jgi:CRP-like cAMP-binding protein